MIEVFKKTKKSCTLQRFLQTDYALVSCTVTEVLYKQVAAIDTQFCHMETVSTDSAMILDLQRENEILKDTVAWLQYGPDALNTALANNNTTGTDIICTCESCLVNKRFAQLDLELLNQTFGLPGTEVNTVCVLKKCLKIQCQKLGLECQETKEPAELECDNKDEDEEENPGLRDCHVVIINSWLDWEVVFGTKLVLSGFHTNPALDKLKELFSTLNYGDDEFFQDGDTNYFTLADARGAL